MLVLKDKDYCYCPHWIDEEVVEDAQKLRNVTKETKFQLKFLWFQSTHVKSPTM